MPISKRVFFPRYVVLTSVVWLLVAVCPVLHGTQYSTLVLFSPHALFLDDIINYYSSKCHLYDDGSQLYAVLVPSTSLNSRIKSPTTQMDISIWMSHRHLRFVMSQTRILYLFSPLLLTFSVPSFYLSRGCHHHSNGTQIPSLPSSTSFLWQSDRSEVEAYIGCCRNIKEYDISDWSEPQV